MLTRHEITLIVAALQFWAEEMDLGDTVMLAMYSGDPLVDRIWTPDEIQRLRTQLNSARLKYAVANEGGPELRTTDLFSTPEAAHQAKTAATDQVGTLLLPASTLGI